MERWPRPSRTSARAALAAALTVLVPGCGPEAPGPPRVFDDAERGYRLSVAPGWMVFGDELRSRSHTLLSAQVHDLGGADRTFVEELPDSLVPQLDAWTAYYFARVGSPQRRSARVGGLEASELVYPVQVRRGRAPGRVVYWVVRRETRLYTFRGVLPAQAPPSDEAELRGMIASLEFAGHLTAPAPDARR